MRSRLLLLSLLAAAGVAAAPSVASAQRNVRCDCIPMRATRDRFDAQERLRARAADRAAEQRTRNLELAAKRAVARSEANARATRVRLDREFERRERAALARERAAMTRAVRPHAVYRNRW